MASSSGSGRAAAGRSSSRAAEVRERAAKLLVAVRRDQLWDVFAKICGDDKPARALFGQITASPRAVATLEAVLDDPAKADDAYRTRTSELMRLATGHPAAACGDQRGVFGVMQPIAAVGRLARPAHGARIQPVGGCVVVARRRGARLQAHGGVRHVAGHTAMRVHVAGNRCPRPGGRHQHADRQPSSPRCSVHPPVLHLVVPPGCARAATPQSMRA